MSKVQSPRSKVGSQASFTRGLSSSVPQKVWDSWNSSFRGMTLIS
jgi:hypothetical protein